MYTYYTRILDKYDRSITAYAILTEGSNKPRPNFYERSFLGTRLLYEYNVFKISEQDDEQLYADGNPFALAVLVAKSAFVGKHIEDRHERDRVLLETKLRLMKAMLTRNIPKDKIRSLVIFLTYYVNFHLTQFVFYWQMRKRYPCF